MMRLLAMLSLCLSLASACHAQGYSYADWSIAGSDVTLRVIVPEAAARPLAGDGIQAVTAPALSRYVAGHVDVHTGADACPPIDQGEDVGLIDTLAPVPGEYRYEIVFRCPHAGALRLDSHILFDRAPGHVEFARLQLQDGRTITRLFDAAHQSVIVPPDGGLAGTSLISYAILGGSQVVGATARIAFVLALLLGLRRREDYIIAGVGLAAGYALSIVLAAGAVIAARPEIAETTIGLLTLLLAARAATLPARSARAAAIALAAVVLPLGLAEWLASHIAHAVLLFGEAALAPSLLLLRGSARALSWLVPTLLFGVLDGAGFSAAVTAIGLPGFGAILPLAVRHLGALLSIALLSALAAAFAWLAQRRRWQPVQALLNDLASAGLAGFGMFWFISRLHA